MYFRENTQKKKRGGKVIKSAMQSIKTYYTLMQHCNPGTNTENTYVGLNTALRDDHWCSNTLNL